MPPKNPAPTSPSSGIDQPTLDDKGATAKTQNLPTHGPPLSAGASLSGLELMVSEERLISCLFTVHNCELGNTKLV